MSAPNSSSRARLLAASTLTIAAAVMLPTDGAFAADAAPIAPLSEASAEVFAVPADTATATAALAATPWQTTSAVDQNGNPVALSDPRAANFVGNAYFKANGTYTMFNLDDSPKLKGDWEMQIIDGQLVRWINAKNDAGTVLFQRIVPIVDLDSTVFTYRVIDATDPSQWVDIVHTPTTHAEPGTIDLAGATAALAATPWETTSAVDERGNPIALSDPRAANFVGNAYFKADGTFTMYNLDDSPKMQGDWEMQIADGQLVRWIAAKNAEGAVLFERIVPIVDLDTTVFTYRVVDAADPSQWVDIVHTSTTHAEPGTTPGSGDEEGDVDGNADNENNTGNGNQNGTGDQQAGDSNGKGDDNDGTKLPNTGGTSALAGIISAVTAVLGGLALLIRSALRRRLG